MTHIRFISSSTIRAAVNPNELTQRIELTPWDLHLLLINYIQKGLLFLKPTPSQLKGSSSSVIEHLKTSFSNTLDIFYPLAGRLVKVENDDDKTTSFFLDCCRRNNLIITKPGTRFVSLTRSVLVSCSVASGTLFLFGNDRDILCSGRTEQVYHYLCSDKMIKI